MYAVYTAFIVPSNIQYLLELVMELKASYFIVLTDTKITLYSCCVRKKKRKGMFRKY